MVGADVQRRVERSEELLGGGDEVFGGKGADADAVGVVDLDRVGQGAAQQFPVPRVERDRKTLSGRIVGTGSDQRSRSSTQGEIRYQLLPIEQGAATRVELSIGYSLRGMLAQIAREGLVRDLASRLTADFARNLEQELLGVRPDGSERSHDLNGVSLLIELLRSRMHKAIQRVLFLRRRSD